MNTARVVAITHLGIDHLSGPLGFGEEQESLLKCISKITSDFGFNS